MQTRAVKVCDRTLVGTEDEVRLSFREKIEYCKLADRLGAAVIQLNPIRQKRIDSLLIKSISTAVRNAVIAVPVDLDVMNMDETWEALKGASSARLQVSAPISSVQMEYLFHRKPADVRDTVSQAVRKCASLTENVEFVAEDATRSDRQFLSDMLKEVIAQGATTVTICDDAGSMLPDQIERYIQELLQDVPELKTVTLGFSCANSLFLADSCAFSAARAGVQELKAVVCRNDYISMPNILQILKAKGGDFGLHASFHAEQINQIVRQIAMLFQRRGALPAGDAASADESSENMLHADDTRQTVLMAVQKLGYDLSQEDQDKIWDSFLSMSSKKATISLRELEAIVAAKAMQVPAAIHDLQYSIHTDHTLGAMARMRMMFHEQTIEGVSSGDGVVDAAFLAIENALGRHFELDDFQIQAITEGREALGETIVKLRNEGKLYSGRGLSTDIVGSSIMAYINALNKIVFEEEEA